MPERLRFERELNDLGLYESETFSEWQKRGKRLAIDFYDRSHSHLQYLGRLVLRSNTDQWEIRLINRGDLEEIYKANRLKAADSADFAFSPPWAVPEDRVFPKNRGKQPQFNRTKIAEQSLQQSLKVHVWDDAKQTKHLKGLLKRAKDQNVEQGSYIVMKVSPVEKRAALYFLRANPVSSSRTHFRANYGARGAFPHKIRYVPNDENKQVIGLVHTHFLKKEPMIEQTTTTGTKWRPAEKVEKLVHAVSAEDINSAKENQFIGYAIEADQIHKAMPTGKAINGLKWPMFNVLTDALDSFAGRTTY